MVSVSGIVYDAVLALVLATHHGVCSTAKADVVRQRLRSLGAQVTAADLLVLMHGKTLDDYPHLAQAAEAMLDDVIWWGTALRAARSAVNV